MHPASLIESGSIAYVVEFPKFQLIPKLCSGIWISFTREVVRPSLG